MCQGFACFSWWWHLPKGILFWIIYLKCQLSFSGKKVFVDYKSIWMFLLLYDSAHYCYLEHPCNRWTWIIDTLPIPINNSYFPYATFCREWIWLFQNWTMVDGFIYSLKEVGLGMVAEPWVLLKEELEGEKWCEIISHYIFEIIFYGEAIF